MAEIPSLVPLHCAFCLKHLPVDGAPTVACARCATPYCSVDCRAKDKTEGCRLRWNEATFDEETGEYRPPRAKHDDVVCGVIAGFGLEKDYAHVESLQERLAAVRECSGQIERAARDLDEPPTCYICLEGGEGLVRECKRRRLRLRDVDRRAEVASAEPKIPNEARISRAGMRDSHAWAHFYGKGLTTLSQWGEQDDDDDDEDYDDDEDDEKPSSSLPSPPLPQDEPRSRCVVS